MLYGFSGVILQGALVTLELAISSVVLAVLIGLAGAGAKLSANKPLALIFEGYTTLIRGVPDLVLMLLIFYGAAIGINNFFESIGSDFVLDLNPFIAGVATLGFIYGAYMTETFRGAIMAIPRGQMEAAWAFGMGPVRTFLRITLPQMVRYALPGYTNNWLVLIKATALVSLISLHDMTYMAKQASAATREPFIFLMFAAALYLVFTSISLSVLKRINARYSLGTEKVQL